MSEILGCVDVNDYGLQSMVNGGGGSSPEDLSVELAAQDSALSTQQNIIDELEAALDNKISLDLTAATSDATATASDMAEGKTAYANGEKVTGTASVYTHIRTLSLTPRYISDMTDRIIGETSVANPVHIDKDGKVQMVFNKSTLAPRIGVTANKIKKDEVICGVTGTYEGANVPDWSQIGYSTVPVELIDNFTTSKTIYDNWDSTQTNLTSKFNGKQTLRYMPLIDTHNAQITTSMFQGCSGLEAMPVLDLSNVNSMNDMFVFCSNLSNASLNNVMQMLINATSYAGTKTLKTVGFTKNQCTRCQALSNWDTLVEAGWTTGY